jgi:hypothetical protein
MRSRASAAEERQRRSGLEGERRWLKILEDISRQEAHSAMISPRQGIDAGRKITTQAAQQTARPAREKLPQQPPKQPESDHVREKPDREREPRRPQNREQTLPSSTHRNLHPDLNSRTLETPTNCGVELRHRY